MAHGIDPWYSPKWNMVLTHGIHLECSLFKWGNETRIDHLYSGSTNPQEVLNIVI